MRSSIRLCEYLKKTDTPQLKKMASRIGNFEGVSQEKLRFNFGSLLERLRLSLERILEEGGETKEQKLEWVIAVLI